MDAALIGFEFAEIVDAILLCSALLAVLTISLCCICSGCGRK